jgi:4'-phosphopantetheinyl transferase
LSAALNVKAYFFTRRQADLPVSNDWLSPAEAVVAEGFRFPKRRADWMLGRWTAKSALIRMPGLPDRVMADWQILASADGAPAVWLDGELFDIPLSLSHSGSCSLCAVAESAMLLGCDLERIEARGASFEETFFTASERELLDRFPPTDRPALSSMIWSAKESVLKALHLGLRADTWRVVVSAIERQAPHGWSRFAVTDEQQDSRFSGWWRICEEMVFTVASDRRIAEPRALQPH